MQTLEIVRFGHEALRSPARPVQVFHKKFHAFVDALAASLRAEDHGAALAAPQVAELRQVIVIRYQGEYLELVNPRIVAAEGAEDDEEGCLSLPGYTGVVTRAVSVEVVFQDRHGKEHSVARSGRMARCLQHEIDHLHGVLYTDRMTRPFLSSTEGGLDLSLAAVQKIAGPLRHPLEPLPPPRPGSGLDKTGLLPHVGSLPAQ